MKLLKYIISFLLFVLILPCNMFAQNKSADKSSNKIVVIDNNSYICTIEESRNMGVNLLTSNIKGEHIIRKYFLPLKVSSEYHKYPLCWDVAYGYIFSITISEVHHAQRNFKIIRIPLSKIEHYKIKQGKVPLLLFGDQITNIRPLASAFVKADVLETGNVYYDFYAITGDSIELYILSNKQLHVWRYENKNWLKITSFNSNFDESFKIIKKDGSVFFLTDTGKLFLGNGLEQEKVEIVTLEYMENISSENIESIIVDKNLGNVFFVSKQEIVDLSNPPIRKQVSKNKIAIVDAEGLMREILGYFQIIYGF